MPRVDSRRASTYRVIREIASLVELEIDLDRWNKVAAIVERSPDRREPAIRDLDLLGSASSLSSAPTFLLRSRGSL